MPRSPELMSRGDTGLLIVDVQEKLLPAIAGHERLTWNLRRLIDGAGILVVSTDLPEVLGICDRVLVMFRGRIEAQLDPRSATEQDLLLAMQGGLAGEREGLISESPAA